MLFIDCNTPKYTQLISWITQRTQKMKITLNDSSRDLICSYYENDLNGLSQILYQLSIIYPNKNPSYTNIKNLIVNTSSNFNLEHLLNNMLQGSIKRSNYILHQLKRDNAIKPLTILRSIQQIVFLLVFFKRQSLLKNNNKLQILLHDYKYKIKKDHHLLFTQTLERLNLQQLYQIITLLLQMEIVIHQEHLNTIWNNFELLIWLICRKK